MHKNINLIKIIIKDNYRAGRAGRTSPGHCYRLYSSAVFNDEFPLFTEPEIARKPVEDLILQMKDLGIDRIQNFPFPTPPDENGIKAAENLLIQLGALVIDKSRTKNIKDEQVTKITELGKTMANFPINPRYAKMLTLASQQEEKDILSYVICLISGLSVPELFLDGELTIIKPNNKETSAEPIKVKYSQMRQQWISGLPNGSNSMLLGDLMLLLVALGAVEYEQFKHDNAESSCIKFCEQYGIRYKAILEAKKLRKQLVNTGNFSKNILFTIK
jgi:ATP-dependent RNA helicase DHX37/DHR1